MWSAVRRGLQTAGKTLRAGGRTTVVCGLPFGQVRRQPTKNDRPPHKDESRRGTHECARHIGRQERKLRTDLRGDRVVLRRYDHFDSHTNDTFANHIDLARRGERESTILPLMNGPRSVMRTSTAFPLERFVTSIHVLKGRVRCAAVSRSMSKISPEEVRRPLYGLPYQLAIPVSVHPMRAGREGGGTCARGRAPHPAHTASITRNYARNRMNSPRGHLKQFYLIAFLRFGELSRPRTRDAIEE